MLLKNLSFWLFLDTVARELRACLIPIQHLPYFLVLQKLLLVVGKCVGGGVSCRVLSIFCIATFFDLTIRIRDAKNISIFISRIREAFLGGYLCSQSGFEIICLFAFWGVDLAPAVQKVDNTIHQAPVVQTLDSAIHWINHYPVDKYLGNKLRYRLDRDLSGGWRYPAFEKPRPDKLIFTG